MSEANVQANLPAQQSPKRIPYATADYGRLRRDNSYYVDFVIILLGTAYH
jgi:hypothetical protein